jgi:RNA polymerase sigma factor (sigma-70 family)
MSWDRLLDQAQHILADLYPTKDDALRIIRSSGLTPKSIGLSDIAMNTWQNILLAADEAGTISRILDTVLRDYPSDATLKDLKTLCEDRAPTRSTADSFIEHVAALYELLQYSVEKGRPFAGHPTDLFLTFRQADFVFFRAIACHERSVTTDDYYAFQRLLRLIKMDRQYRRTDGTIVSTKPFAEDVVMIAERDDVTLTTVDELSAKLIDAREYAQMLLGLCGSNEQYPTEYYVTPRLSRTTGEEPSPADKIVNKWLMNTDSPFLAILGDVGTGKSFLLRTLATELATTYLIRPFVRPVPILIDLRNADREFSLEGLVLTHCQRNSFRAMTFPTFEYALRHGRLILLLDGFDEMAARTSPDVTRRNFQQLASCAKDKAKVILTCRTHFFMSRTEEEEIILGSLPPSDSPRASDLLRNVIDRTGFEILYLRPFEIPQITEYVEKAKRKDAQQCLRRIESVYNLMELAQRPMLLQMIVKFIDQLGSSEVNPAKLYEVFTGEWLGRETWRGIMTTERKVQFVAALSMVLWQEGMQHLHYSQLAAHLGQAFASDIQSPRTHAEIDSEIRTAGFLTRDELGNYGFAHKSYAEYFVSRGLASHLNQGDTECLRTRGLTREIITFLKDMIDLDVVEGTLEETLRRPYTPLLSENALCVLYGVRKQSLIDRASLAGTDMPELIVGLPEGINLPGAQLADIDLEGAVLKRADLQGAIMTNATLIRCDLEMTSFSRANLAGAILKGAAIGGVDFTETILDNCDVDGVRHADSAVFSPAAIAKAAKSSMTLQVLVRRLGLVSQEDAPRTEESIDYDEIRYATIRFCIRYGLSSMDHEDIASKVTTDLYIATREGRFTWSNMDVSLRRRYVESTCRMAALSYLRRHDRKREVTFSDAGIDANSIYDTRPSSVESAEYIDELNEAFSRVSETLDDQGKAVLKLLYDEMSVARIAQEVGISVSSVSRIVFRIRKTFYERVAGRSR